MDKVRAHAILSALANGAHPGTGEVFPPDSPYQTADVVRALYVALRTLEGAASGSAQPSASAVTTAGSLANTPASAYSERTRAGRENAGKPWSPEEDRQLLAGFDAGRSIRQLAEQHGRGASGIEARLVKLGRIELSPKLAASLRSNPAAGANREAAMK